MKAQVARLISTCAMCISLVLFLTGISAAEIDPATIVGMWLMDEGSGDKVGDSSGNGHDGEIKGGVEWIDGEFGQALKFDGTGHVNAGNVPLAENQVTVVLRVYADPTISFIQYVIEEGMTEHVWQGSFILALVKEGDTFIAIGDGAAQVNNAGLGVATGWTYDKWFHWGFTYDGETARHYQDGEESHTIVYSMDITTGTGTLNLGGMRGETNFFQGRLDEVAIFNAVLSQDDIKTIMAEGLEEALVTAAVSPSSKLPIAWGEIKRDGIY